MSGDESSVIRSSVEGLQQTAAPHSFSRLADISVPQYATSGAAAAATRRTERSDESSIVTGSGGADEELQPRDKLQQTPAASYSSYAPQNSLQSTDGDKSKLDSGSSGKEMQQIAVPSSSCVPAAVATADVASQNRALTGTENAPFDDNDVPFPVEQIDASHKEMEYTTKNMEVAIKRSEEPGSPAAQIAALHKDIDDNKNTNMQLESIEENELPAGLEPCLGFTSKLQQPYIDTIVLPAGHVATPLPDPPIEPCNTGDDDNRPPSSRSGRLKYILIALFLIVGVMAGILGTLFFSPSNGNVSETALGIRGVTTTRPSSSFSPIPNPTPAPVPPSGISLTVSNTVYEEGEDIVIDFDYSDNPGLDAWIGLWPADSDPQALPSPSAYWKNICSNSQSSACGTHPTAGVVTLNADSEGSWTWPLTCGSWRAYLILSGAGPSAYSSAAASVVFTVGTSAICENAVCNASPEDANPTNTHLVPSDGAKITKIAFGSCFIPGFQTNGSLLWQHVRDNFGSNSIWNWLGDNMYQDTNDSQAKRNAYNAARSDSYYTQYGPIAEPKIPTTGTWDDHDYGINNSGNNYECRQSSQNEFVYHFNVPETDPRHPAYAGGQQEGIYSSYMFQSDSGAPGIHLINLDARYHRSPTFASYGPCEGASSTILGSVQWNWLENELSRPSEIKIIGSGSQVLPPTHRGRSLSSYCSYDGSGNTFDSANLEIGEGPGGFDGTSYETWAEIPQERTRLLKLVQEIINAGSAKHVIFLSGDQHWAEMMVKEIPARSGQPAVSVFEVTGSGIDQRWLSDIVNSNRLRPEDFGFGLRRDLQSRRTLKGKIKDSRRNDRRGLQTAGATPIPDTAIKSITYSNSNTCSGDLLHICSATANYGGIEVDWVNQEVHLSIYTPFENVQEAARVTLDLGAASAATPKETI